MGLEASCEVRLDGKVARGKARLEEKEIVFRGDFNLRVPFKGVRSFEARQGRLTVRFGRSVAVFELGTQAEKWALKMRYPRSLMEKLGVRAVSKVSVLGIADAAFWREVRETGADVSERPRRDSDLILVAMSKLDDLKRLRRLRDSIRPEGAIWVVWPKGRREFREDDVRAAGPQAGLVDVKVVRFSDALAALKMMIPVKLRSEKIPLTAT